MGPTLVKSFDSALRMVKPQAAKAIKKGLGVTLIAGLAIAFSFAAVAVPGSTQAATTLSSEFGNTSTAAGNGSSTSIALTSDMAEAEPYAGLDFDITPGISWADLDTLSTDYNVTDDDCGGGSPRFQINVDTTGDGVSDGNVHVAIGPSPSFTDCAAGWQTTGNVIGNEDAGRYDYSQFGGSTFTTYSNAPASVTAGTVVGIQLVVDGGWFFPDDQEQTILVDNVTINEDVFTFEDEEGPVVSNVMTDPNPAQEGDIITLTADADDTTTGGSTIASAEYQIDGGTWFAATASDGAFDEVMEEVTATLGLTQGSYEVCVRATDAEGNVGDAECATVEVDFNTPVTKDECKNGGWMTFTDANGNTFKNQGDCVSFVATQGKNTGSGTPSVPSI